MEDISKDFINTFLKIVNRNSNSSVRSKAGYGIFEIDEWKIYGVNKVCMTLWYRPTKYLEGFDQIVIRKTYDLTLDHLEVFQSHFYYDVITYLTGSHEACKLINNGIER